MRVAELLKGMGPDATEAPKLRCVLPSNELLFVIPEQEGREAIPRILRADPPEVATGSSDFSEMRAPRPEQEAISQEQDAMSQEQEAMGITLREQEAHFEEHVLRPGNRLLNSRALVLRSQSAARINLDRRLAVLGPLGNAWMVTTPSSSKAS